MSRFKDCLEQVIENADTTGEALNYVRKILQTAMIHEALKLPRVKRQIRRTDQKRPSDDESLVEYLSLSEAGSRILNDIFDTILGIERERQLRALANEVEAAADESLATKSWVEMKIRQFGSKVSVDPRVRARKTLERAVQGLRKAGKIEELVGIQIRSGRDLEARIAAAAAEKLFSKPLAFESRPKSSGHSSVLCSWAQNRGGKKYGVVGNFRLLGQVGSLHPTARICKKAGDIFQKLNLVSLESVIDAACEIARIKPQKRKSRGSASSLWSLPGVEAERVVLELAEAIRLPTLRNIFFTGLYRTLPPVPPFVDSVVMQEWFSRMQAQSNEYEE